MSFWVYKQFGKVIGETEFNATRKKRECSCFTYPYWSFIVWKEQVKRYIKADYHLKDDNPFGCTFYFCIILIVFLIMLLGKLIL